MESAVVVMWGMLMALMLADLTVAWLAAYLVVD